MSDLHIALLLLALVLLAALFLYSKWQERRTLRELDASLRQGVTDALMTPPAAAAPPASAATPPTRESSAPQDQGNKAHREAHSEADSEAEYAPPPYGPAYSEPVQLRGLVPRSEGARVEPRFDWSTLEASADTSVPSAPPMRADARAAAHLAAGGWTEDPLLDCVLELRCAHATDGVAVLDAAGILTRTAAALPVHLAVWDARTQQWTHPDRFGFYSELLVATQLATRRHALDEIEVSRFISATQQIAVALDADFDAPDVARIVALAKELEATSARFDVQIGLTLESATGPWEPALLEQAAQRAGLTRAAELSAAQRGAPAAPAQALRWRYVDAQGFVLFTLSSASLLNDRLVLELDVPLAPAAAQPLRTMAASANLVAQALGTRVVDDIGRPIDAGSLAAIEAQLEAVYADMRAAGIEPGSLRAQRLYG
jgi:hypothetical protein